MSISTEDRRRFPDRDRTGAEGFQHEADLFQILRALGQPRGILLRQLDDFRDQQDLPRDTALRERGP
jgi:hypothetical protein